MSSKLDPTVMLTKGEINDSLPNTMLNRQQSDKFIDLVVDYSNLLKQVRTKRINYNKGEINKLDLGKIVTEGADIASNPFYVANPDATKIEYDTVKYRAGFDLTTDFTEDNLQGKSIRDTLLAQFSKAISLDSERAFLQSDSSIAPTASSSVEDKLLGVNDGIFKILGATIAQDGAAATNVSAVKKATSLKYFYDMKKAIPKRYRNAKSEYRWLVSDAIYDKWAYDQTGRVTAYGDAAIQGKVQNRPLGIGMIDCPMIKEDIVLTAGTILDGTRMMLTPLKNLIYFIQREITVEWERVPRSDLWQFTVHYRCDFTVENRAMVVTGTNISESQADC